MKWPVVILGMAASAAMAKPVQRQDLSPALGAAICAGEATTTKLWAAGVHDAQVEGRMVERRDGLTVDTRVLQHKAKALAQVLGDGGYAFGLCPKAASEKNATRGWAVALPAPKPLLAKGNEHLELPHAELRERCSTYRVDYAARDSGQAKLLGVDSASVSLKGLTDGVVSVTCQPKAPRWRGPVLWYLYPVGQGAAPLAPEAETLAGAPVDGLGPWINRVRGREGLRPLEFKDALSQQASILAADHGMAHNRLLLQKVESKLEGDKLHLLGENRVRGANAEAMAWLWWNSPRHRELMLNPDATSAGLAIEHSGEESLAVLVLASDQPLKTAKRVRKSHGS